MTVSVRLVVSIAAALAAGLALAVPGVLGGPPPNQPVTCAPLAGVVTIRSAGEYSHLVDRVVVGYRPADNTIRVDYSGASKDEGPYNVTTDCTAPGPSWRSVNASLSSGGDLFRLDAAQMPPEFEPLPTSIVARANGGESIDRLLGHAGIDVLRGGRSSDELYGYGGADVLAGGQRDDQALVAGPGSDEIRAADGRKDARILCGPGRDLAIVDREDNPRGCERVKTR